MPRANWYIKLALMPPVAAAPMQCFGANWKASLSLAASSAGAFCFGARGRRHGFRNVSDQLRVCWF
jgi:hypothetical protein